MVELNGVRIWAVLFEGGQALPPRKLVCGTLARPLGKGDSAPDRALLPARLKVPGRSDLAVAWTGWFELVATGALVGVYGAIVEPVGDLAGSDPEQPSRAGKRETS